MLHRIILALGSNDVDAPHLLEEAITMMKEVLSIKKSTRQLRSQAINHGSSMFTNMMIEASTPLDFPSLSSALKQTEQRIGRVHDSNEVVKIDIDILQYDDSKCHVEDWERPYIQTLLEELNP